MRLKGLVDVDAVNYKDYSMFLVFAVCNFKCDKLNGCQVCQNSHLIYEPTIEVSNESLIRRYMGNPLTHAVVCGGLDPCDQFSELITFIKDFRTVSPDPIIIYTGYTKEELQLTGQLDMLRAYSGIIIKFGRYLMGYEPHTDPILGVKLASPNQYAERIS